MAAVTLLATRGLSRSFGGLAAVDSVDFVLPAGEIRAIIGPNGAGKTTFVSLVCGRVKPDAGSIAFAGEDITALPAHRRVARGIAYTFQITSVFANLSAFDNVALAAQNSMQRHSAAWRPLDAVELGRRVEEALQRVGLEDRARAKASTLAYGHQRLLEVAMGLALTPKLLILDEPTQGLSDAEIAGFCALVRTIAESATVLLIEHNMAVVMELADRITVMNGGRILAEGAPAEIRANEAVQLAYLGRLMLEIRGIDCFYGTVQVLRGVSFELSPGEVLCLLGRNGAGKTTTLKAIMGLVRPRAGRILLDGVDLTALPAHAVPREGVAYVPQGRRLFAELTVRENLEIGLMTRRTGPATLDRVLALFPALGERLRQRAGTLSGGEQQMLAMARALCIEPKVLLLDEPTEGLMPSMIARIREAVNQLKAEGVATILVEQRVEAVLQIADRVAFIETGSIRAILDVEAVRGDASLLHRYVGVGG